MHGDIFSVVYNASFASVKMSCNGTKYWHGNVSIIRQKYQTVTNRVSHKPTCSVMSAPVTQSGREGVMDRWKV